jgi:hypothetical protein
MSGMPLGCQKDTCQCKLTENPQGNLQPESAQEVAREVEPVWDLELAQELVLVVGCRVSALGLAQLGQ